MKTKEKEKYIPALSFDFLTPFYDVVVKWMTRETVFKEKLARQIEIIPNGRLLDLACGTATLTIALKEKLSQAEIHGLDGDAKILGIARRKAAANGTEINFTEGFSIALQYPDEYFDAVVSSLFFHHLTSENKLKTLLEVRRVLKSGGTLHVADWGKPANPFMKLASMPVQWFDGATTTDSYQGKLPELMAETGFADINETGSFGTVFGTLRLHRAVKNPIYETGVKR